MPKALKGRMPRVLPDHRSTLAKRLRAVYDEIGKRYPLQDGVARRIALLAARAWVDYEDMAKATSQRRKPKATEINRLRRRQATCAGQFLSGLRSLEALTSDSDGKGVDLTTALAMQRMPE